MHGVSRSLGFALHFATSTRGGAAPLRGPGDLRAMRKTRLADQRDDGHCMSANSAVTLMKEAVDSAIKHGDIRLDAVGGLTVSTERHRHAALTLRLLPCRLRRPSACPGNTCANGSTHGARPSDDRHERACRELLILSLPPGFPPLLIRPPLLVFTQHPKPAVGHEACRVAAARAKPGDRGAEQSQSRHVIRRCVRPATRPPSALTSPGRESIPYDP